MSTTTPKLGLKKPDYTDFADIKDWNDNMDILDDICGDIAKQIYPIGSIYMSVNSTSPETLFPGTTWAQIKDTFLLAAGTTYAAGGTGGAATVTLTSSQMPSHTHSGPSHSHSVGAHSHSIGNHSHSIPSLSGSTNNTGSHSHQLKGYVTVDKFNPSTGVASWADYDDAGGSYTRAAGAHSHSVTTNASTTGSSGSGSTGNSSAFNTGASGTGNTGSTGGGGAHNNMPPYLTVYMWKRTA